MFISINKNNVGHPTMGKRKQFRIPRNDEEIKELASRISKTLLDDLDRGWIPFTRPNRKPATLPCGRSVNGVSYCESVSRKRSLVLYGSIQYVYACVDSRKFKCKRLYLGSADLVCTKRYFDLVQKAIDIRSESLLAWVELCKREASYDYIYFAIKSKIASLSSTPKSVLENRFNLT